MSQETKNKSRSKDESKCWQTIEKYKAPPQINPQYDWSSAAKG